jgi:predicted enzyme related to lactoylglutathione lyase
MPNKFFWYDVMTTDVAAAEKFYRDVVGWGVLDSGQPGYTVFTVDGHGVAGLMPIPEDARGMPPCWMGYIHVDDVEDAVARIQQEGGRLYRGPFDIPETIRIAVVADPQGAGFLVAKPLSSAARPDLPVGTQGTIGWHELLAADGKSAFAFYEKLFGWTAAEAHDMGPMGTYQLFATGGEPVGGMMTKPPAVPVPNWGYYINVPAIDAATSRITASGGKILNGPMQVPGGQWIVQAMDPQGAAFSLVAWER